MGRTALPVDGIVPSLLDALQDHPAVAVAAPPGSGKTTRIPPAVAAAVPGRTLLLQPRRVAARACARRLAQEDGSDLGDRFGYWVRFDKRFGPESRVVVVTEGILTRMLQSDPFLDGIDAVILDEFHERSIHSDLALALVAEVMREARPDLKLIVMSATLNAAPVVSFLGGPARCPTITAEGRRFPVAIEHRSMGDHRLETAVARAIRDAVERDPSGHVLAFLPGAGEIDRVHQALSDLPNVVPLHGRLSPRQQDDAIRPSDTQRVILATNIAETSLTIDGVTAVVDAGLVRRPRFDARLGVERLETVPISLASAEQRAGRAGRTREGRCIRLWSSAEHLRRPAHDDPAIAREDLASTALQLHAWGTTPSRFEWFEAPPSAALRHATGLLEQLGAIDAGTLTQIGRELVRLPVHPRLGSVVRAGARLGVLPLAAGAAALASERDPWRDRATADLMDRLDWLGRPESTGANPHALRAVRAVQDDLIRIGRSMTGRSDGHAGTEHDRTLQSLLAGFPDRVGRRRDPSGRAVLLANGSGVDLDRTIECGEWMLAIVLTAGPRGRAPLVRVAAEFDPAILDCDWVEECSFDRETDAVSARRVRRWGALVIETRPAQQRPSPDAVAAVLAEAARGHADRLFPETGAYGRLMNRLRFAARVHGQVEWPDWIADPTRLIDDWCVGKRSFADLRKMDCAKAALERLPYPLRTALNRVAPDTFRVPSGAAIRLEYPPNEPPVLAARIQQVFGMMETPTVGGVPITIHLLAPNNRPAQVTQDLASFWSSTYADVRKDLRGRYPKHAWPEDPSQAIPENRPRRKR
ncbi:MAG: ATP-dependent helicase HrpB [Myxococcota bacterium]|nr:ATP-dependent helicase HrpB [Myxococcota bacterium]